MPRNPCSTAQALIDELNEALGTIRVADARAKELHDLHQAAVDLHAGLVYFNDTYVPLDLPDEELESSAYQLWANLEPGQIRRGDADLTRMIAESIPLGQFRKAGIEITGLRKWASDELGFARVLGDSFTELAPIWAQMRLDLSHQKFSVQCTKAELRATRELLAAAETVGYLGVRYWRRRAWDRTSGQGTWIDIDLDDPKSLAKVNDKVPFRAYVEVVSRKQESLFTGEWLNAYAARLLDDHLVANGIVHEIYTNVAYGAPRDIINVTSDFDVLVYAGGRVAAFECKTGRRADIQEVREKAAGLRRVFEATEADVDLTTFLLYTPSTTSREEVEEGLRGTDVVPVVPEELRLSIQRLFART